MIIREPMVAIMKPLDGCEGVGFDVIADPEDKWVSFSGK